MQLKFDWLIVLDEGTAPGQPARPRCPAVLRRVEGVEIRAQEGLSLLITRWGRPAGLTCESQSMNNAVSGRSTSGADAPGGARGQTEIPG